MTGEQPLPRVIHTQDDQPAFQKRAQWSVILAMLTAVMALAATVTLMLYGIQNREDVEQREDAAAQLQTEAVAREEQLTTRLEVAEATIACRDDAAADAALTAAAAQSASVELIIETAEQFNAVISGQTPDHDALATRIVTARQALDEAAQANAVYVAALAECTPPPEGD